MRRAGQLLLFHLLLLRRQALCLKKSDLGSMPYRPPVPAWRATSATAAPIA